MLEYKNMKKMKKVYAIILICLYIISFILVNIGFYSPEWYKLYEQWPDVSWWWWYPRNRVCNEVGLVSGDCRYPYTGIDKGQGEKGFVLRTTFYMMMTSICVLYMSFLFLVTGIIFNMLESPIFMGFGSIIAGVLYPAAAVLTIVASVYAELSNRSKIGYAAIITNIGGGLMLICYVMLRMYKKVFRRIRKYLEVND